MLNPFISFLSENSRLFGEMLGFIAGLIVLASGLPTIKVQFRSPRAGTRDERLGHLYLAIGNAVLVFSCLLTGVISIASMALINVGIRLTIWFRMLKCVDKLN